MMDNILLQRMRIVPRRIAPFLTWFLLPNSLPAQSVLGFKKDPLNTLHWFPYLLVLAGLLGALIFLAKKSKGSLQTNAKSQIIEQISVHHKMRVYVLDYQGQRFLIADNQNALAIHSLTKDKSYEN